MKWTYDNCLLESRKFKTLKEFRQCNQTAYRVAYANGWLSEYIWLNRLQRPKGYWTYARCKEIALRYTILKDFRNENKDAYNIAKNNKWIEDYIWLDKNKTKPKNYWNYEKCFILAKTCNKRIELFKKNSTAYYTAIKNNWIKDYVWFMTKEEINREKQKSNIKWTYEKCRNIALKYKTRRNFKKYNPLVYMASCRNGWLSEFTWLIRCEEIYNINNDNVYCYCFNSLNAVYIGRTISLKERQKKHHTLKSIVYRFAMEHNVPIPTMTILKTNLTINEGLIIEDYYLKKFKREGWTILNVGKTGKNYGAIGNLMKKR